MKLISMTDFVLEQFKICPDSPNQMEAVKYFLNCKKYAEFLKQPLTLGMFVPTDEEGRVWEAPKGCCSGRECGCMGQPVNYYSQKDIDKYYKLEEKVFFKGVKHNNIQPSTDWNYYSLKGNKIAEANNLGKYNLVYRLNTVEDLINRIKDIELTEYALKQIGLNP